MYSYFSNNELKCKCGKCNTDEKAMSVIFMERLIALREYLNFPFIVTSGVRCLDHQMAVSTITVKLNEAPHVLGRGIDIQVFGRQALSIISHAADFGFTGIGIQQKGGIISRFIHLDNLPANDHRNRPWVWTY